MRRILYGVLVALLVAGSPVWAKKKGELLEMPTEDLFDLPLEELLDVEIASAGKMAEKISEIPASVYIVTRSEIEKYGYRTVSEIIRNIPGFYTSYNYQQESIGIRGILNENNIVILVNGVTQHSSNIEEIMVSSDAIDRIEVVRGPMSVIYGSGAFLGSINIVTNQTAYGEASNMVSVSYGSDNTWKGFARTSGEKGDFRYTLNATIRQTDGPDENYSDMMNPKKYESLDPAAHKTTDGDLESKNGNVNFSAGYGGFYADFQYNRFKSGQLDGSSVFGDGNTYESQITTTQIGYRHDISSTFSFDGKVIYSFKDTQNTDNAYNPDIFETGSSSSIDGEEKRIEAELDLTWKPTDSLSTITGINYKRYFDSSYTGSFPIPLSPDILSTTNGTYDISDRETRAVFMQVNYKPFDRLKLVAGARLEQYMSFDADLTLLMTDENIRLNQNSTYNKDEDVYFIPRAAAVYSLNDHHIFKLMYGKANKPFDVYNIDLERPFQESFEPEEIETVEMNYLMSYSDYSISFSLFRNNIENLLKEEFNYDENGNVTIVMTNSARQLTYGGELIASARPVKNLNLEFSATYQETDKKESDAESTSFSPNLLMKAKAAYLWENGFSIGLTGLYIDKMDGNQPPSGLGIPGPKNSDAYFVTDLNFRYIHEKTGLFSSFRISNLFDEEVRYPNTQGSDFPEGTIGEGRSFLATVGWRF